MLNGLRLSVLAMCLWTVSAIGEEPSGNLNLGDFSVGAETSVTIISRNGCREVLRCTGNGTNVEWKREGSRRPLMTGGNKVITTESTPTSVEGELSFVSYLVFDPIEIIDAGMWTCTIDSLTYTADLSIEAALASLVPSQHNISDRFIDDKLAVLCPVESCISNVTVHLLRDGSIFRTQVVATPGGEAPQFNLDIEGSLVEVDHACRVAVPFMGQTFTFDEPLVITGTPQPRPTTPPNQSPSGGGGGGGGGRGSGQSVTYSTNIITLGLVILLMATLFY